MAKQRQDASYIKKIVKVYTGGVELASIPLVVMDNDSSIGPKAMELSRDLVEVIRSGGFNRQDASLLPDMVKNLLYEAPVDKFLFMNRCVKVNDPGDAGVMSYNYFSVSIIEKKYVILNYFTLHDGIHACILNYDKDNKNLVWSFGVTPSGQESDMMDYSKNTDQRAMRYREFITAMMVTVLAFFKEVSESDVYPVKMQGTQHRKVHEKKPWTRRDLVTIQYLNQLPREKAPHKGGTHASPRLHQRRGTWRRLTNPRFKNHPKYGDKIWVKPCWAGEREAVINGVTYKVL